MPKRKYDIGDTIKYQPENYRSPLTAKVVAVRYDTTAEDPNKRYNYRYTTDAKQYQGDTLDFHEVREEEVIGKIK